MVNQRNIGIFASGNGSNAENIAKYFDNHKLIRIVKIFSNNEHAYVLERAKKLEIPTLTFSKSAFEKKSFLEELASIDYIILAGFLLLIPPYLVKQYENRILNIHPALLPKYGGKGMYGHHVHEAVKASGDQESGISIHLVNEVYDEGEIIFQRSCAISPEDSREIIAAKVHALEYEHYPKVIEQFILGQTVQ